jgi:hypothetical protein
VIANKSPLNPGTFRNARLAGTRQTLHFELLSDRARGRKRVLESPFSEFKTRPFPAIFGHFLNESTGRADGKISVRVHIWIDAGRYGFG